MKLSSSIRTDSVDDFGAFDDLFSGPAGTVLLDAFVRTLNRALDAGYSALVGTHTIAGTALDLPLEAAVLLCGAALSLAVLCWSRRWPRLPALLASLCAGLALLLVHQNGAQACVIEAAEGMREGAEGMREGAREMRESAERMRRQH